jgi:hypothetical protein
LKVEEDEEVDNEVVEEDHDIFCEKFEDVGGVGEFDLFDKAAILFKELGGFVDAGGDVEPEEVAGGEIGDVFGKIDGEEAAEDGAEDDDEDEHAEADPPWTKHGALVALFNFKDA